MPKPKGKQKEKINKQVKPGPLKPMLLVNPELRKKKQEHERKRLEIQRKKLTNAELKIKK